MMKKKKKKSTDYRTFSECEKIRGYINQSEAADANKFMIIHFFIH